MWERRAVIGLHAAVAAAIAVTHTRVPPARLYNSRRGGLSRALVFAGYPTAVAAVGVLPATDGRRRWPALLLCATAAVPGVIDEGDLDGRWRNVPALAGVVLAFTAPVKDVPRSRAGRPALRRALALGAAAVAAPWVLADVGMQTAGMRRPTPGRPELDRVHLGHHEGLDGALLIWDALLLSRRRAGALHGWLLALMAAYGIAVLAKDAWLEQVVKRGLTDRELPDVLRPAPTRGWAALLAATPLVRRLVTG